MGIYIQCVYIYIYVCVYDFSLADGMQFNSSCQIHGPSAVTFGSLLSQELSPSDVNTADDSNKSPVMNNPAFLHSSCPPAMHKSCFCVRLIAEHTKMLEDSTKVSNDLRFFLALPRCVLSKSDVCLLTFPLCCLTKEFLF